jgi:hypothetical protein
MRERDFMAIPSLVSARLGENISHDFARHIGQPEVATRILVRQLGVIHPELIQ